MCAILHSDVENISLNIFEALRIHKSQKNKKNWWNFGIVESHNFDKSPKTKVYHLLASQRQSCTLWNGPMQLQSPFNTIVYYVGHHGHFRITSTPDFKRPSNLVDCSNNKDEQKLATDKGKCEYIPFVYTIQLLLSLEQIN